MRVLLGVLLIVLLSLLLLVARRPPVSPTRWSAEGRGILLPKADSSYDIGGAR